MIELFEQSDAQMRRVRGAGYRHDFPEYNDLLNPVFTRWRLNCRIYSFASGASHEEAPWKRKRMLDQGTIPESQAILSRYPHQLSGVMRQRVMIAMVLSCRPAAC